MQLTEKTPHRVYYRLVQKLRNCQSTNINVTTAISECDHWTWWLAV